MRFLWIAGVVALGAYALAGPGGSGSERPYPAPALKAGQAEAVFAAGCFWCSESDFEKLDGVIDVVSGYAGGRTDQPTYYQVGTGLTGHTEAIRVIYNPRRITYPELVEYFWVHSDPFDGGGQFCDRGSQYRPAIFPLTPEERAYAKRSKEQLEQLLGREVAVELEEMGTFWVAEAYHQDFYKKEPAHYSRYRTGCGRDRRTDLIAAQIRLAKEGQPAR